MTGSPAACKGLGGNAAAAADGRCAAWARQRADRFTDRFAMPVQGGKEPQRLHE
jgi:hypothetical protein